MFPIMLIASVYVFFILQAFISGKPFIQAIHEINENLIEILPLILILATILTLASFNLGDKMMLMFAGAKICPKDKKYTQIHKMVENIALKAGIPAPKVYLISDESLNAFATGYSPKSASISLTTGIVEKLEPIELEAVISHEIGHIMNRDIRLNMFVITGIGIIGTLGDYFIRASRRSRNRSSSKNGRKSAILFLTIGLAFYLFKYLVAPFIQMALSRTQEFQADATGAYITRHPQALASALEKIAVDPRLESLDSSTQMASACICNPLKKIGGLLDTHPSIQERVKRLQNMAHFY